MSTPCQLSQLMSSPFANVKTLSPRVKLAARLYASGLAPTKRAASSAAGLHPQYFTIMSNENELVKRLVGEVDAMIEDETVDITKVLERLGRKAVGKLNHLMGSSQSELIQLKAAQDLADRNPRTQKIQRVDVSAAAFSLSGTDVAALTRAMVESARLKEQYQHVAAEGLVEVTDLQALPEPPKEVA